MRVCRLHRSFYSGCPCVALFVQSLDTRVPGLGIDLLLILGLVSLFSIGGLTTP